MKEDLHVVVVVVVLFFFGPCALTLNILFLPVSCIISSW